MAESKLDSSNCNTVPSTLKDWAEEQKYDDNEIKATAAITATLCFIIADDPIQNPNSQTKTIDLLFKL